MESNPQLVQIVPPNEVVVVISFELTIGDLRGHDEPLHPLQFDRADRRQALGQQLGGLRPPPGHARKPSSRSAARSARRWCN